MERATRYFGWQARLAEEQLGRRVIEIGCGLGNFTRHLVDREKVVALDLVEECIVLNRAQFLDQSNVEFRCLDVQSPEFCDLVSLKPDSIVCLNVLEHVRDDKLALRHMYEVLEPGGRAVFLLPAFESLYGPIDKHLGHFRRYTKEQWRQLVEASGFEVRVSRYFNAVGFFGWWWNARVSKREMQSGGQIALFDSVIVPVMSRVEGWMEPPVGQSIFSVLQKPGGPGRYPVP